MLLALLACTDGVVLDRGGKRPVDSGDPVASTDTVDSVDSVDTVDTVDTASAGPELEVAESTTLPVPTAVGLPERRGFSVNIRVQPHGAAGTWTVEYGPDDSYGEISPARPLPPRLDAHYAESWDGGVHGYAAGIGGKQLSAVSGGGHDGGDHVRYTDDQGAGDDTNHLDGIGVIHLGLYAYLGNYDPGTQPALYLGGGFPDLRGAEVSLYLRGDGWIPNGTQLGTWIQAYRDPTVVTLTPEDSRFPNWAYTGEPLTVADDWTRQTWTLRDQTSAWTFAGCNGGRLLYDYGELDALLSAVNVDLFPVQILYVDQGAEPRGALEYDDLELVYRQHSMLAPFNGGTLVADPGGEGVDLLTDGWRNGVDREWHSDPDPVSPQTFEYRFDTPVVVWSTTVHNAVEYPAETVAIDVSEDGGASWAEIGGGRLDATSDDGPNALFVHDDSYELVDGVATWAPLYAAPVDRLRVRVTSGYQAERWGLGEVEVFGTGAVESTDDAWTDLSRDVEVEPGTWHFRVRVETTEGVVESADQVVVVP